MRVQTNNDYTERYIGVGENKISAINGGDYTVYGVFGSYIEQNMDYASAFAGNVVRENMQGNAYAEFTAIACECIVKMGMCAFRNLLKNQDAYVANKYIIQMLRYCKDDISQYSNIVIDSSVDGVLSSLALPRSQARTIYRDSRINSLNELPNVMFNRNARESLGYMLYYMERAFGIECRQQMKLNEIFEYLNLDYSIWEKYEDYYIDDAVKRTTQVQLAKHLFENIKPDKYRIDSCYYKHTFRKLEKFWPAGVENRLKKGLHLVNNIVSIMENNEEITANTMAEVGGMLFDGNKKQNADDFMENYQKDMYNTTGMGGNDFYKNKVEEMTKDFRNTVHS